MTSYLLRRAALAGLVTTSALLLAAGCGSNSNAGSSSGAMPAMTASATGALPAGVNAADIAFAQMMIPHHQQAVQMASLASAQGSDPQLKQLAAHIKAAQDPEITTMTGWLTAWGQPTAAPSGGSMPGMDMTGGAMPGLMSRSDMARLMAAKGTDFDRMFAQMMIAHHNGAIQMAQDEQAHGANADAKALAGRIITTQQAEVATLQKILDRL